MNKVKVTGALLAQIDYVIRYLDNHRREAAQKLFVSFSQSYIDSWAKMDPIQFWYRLD